MFYSLEDFAKDTDVSRETLDLYQAWFEYLFKWNAKINLVAPKSIDDFWQRHALDSWQITKYIPQDIKTVVDFGSGAGFPALAIAIEFKNRGAGDVTLFESVGKKANFLRTVIRELDLPANVTADRIEQITATPTDLITARAFAPLDKLLKYAEPFWKDDTIGLFHKGETIEQELTSAQKTWHFDKEEIPSLAAENSFILKVEHLRLKT